MSEPTSQDIIRQYLVRMGEIRGTGGATKETSFYSALEIFSISLAMIFGLQ